MSSDNLNCYTCANNTVNIINERILARNLATGNIDVLISPRPQHTLYTMPLENVIPPTQDCNSRIMKYDTHPKQYFLPCTRNGAWSRYSNNINTESILRNQVYAIQNAPQAHYVPSSRSDLYNSTVPNNNNIDSNNEPHAALDKEGQFQFLPPPVDLGNRLFNNDTRQVLKDK